MALTYHPRLDGLRAIAVALVIESHFVERLHAESLGVRLFFVLSGYLISRILWQYAVKKPPALQAPAHFYWRRGLRFFPPLYLAVAICSLLGIAAMRQDWW